MSICPHEGHDYGPSKRTAAYRFLAKDLKLDLNRVLKDGQIDESPNTRAGASRLLFSMRLTRAQPVPLWVMTP